MPAFYKHLSARFENTRKQVLRESMEEQRQRQEEEARRNVSATINEQHTGQTAADGSNEEAMLEQAVAMSLATESNTTTASPAVPDFSAMTEEEQIAYAMQMSLQQTQEGSDDDTDEADEIFETDETFEIYETDDETDDQDPSNVLRESMEEQRHRQEEEARRNVSSTSNEQQTGQTVADVSKEESTLEQDVAMSLATETTASPAVPDFSEMTEEEQIAYAMQVSLQQTQEGSDDKTGVPMKTDNNDQSKDLATLNDEDVDSPRKKVKKEDEEDVSKKLKEKKRVLWQTLEHNGPMFHPIYKKLPDEVKFYYDGTEMKLSEAAEEVAGYYARLMDDEYINNEVFNRNFFKDWKEVMQPQEKEIITDLKKCDFENLYAYFKKNWDEMKMSKEDKLKIEKMYEDVTEKFRFCIIDGRKEKTSNFKIDPPGLFRGRGEHPKMGRVKKRIEAEDVSINIGKEAQVPKPPSEHKWKQILHENTVSWLACWPESVTGSTRYMMLDSSSKLQGEKDLKKFETARQLKDNLARIRQQYIQDFKIIDLQKRQRATALYFIDKLSLRVGNPKGKETTDTVGICSLRVQNITLHENEELQEYAVTLDFLSKDSVRYMNCVKVEKKVLKNLKIFTKDKKPEERLFDKLNTSILNKYLNDIMEGLTAKVFRTYNASNTLQEQLDLCTKEEMSTLEKISTFNKANRAVAKLCNHKKEFRKALLKSTETLKLKIEEKVNELKKVRQEVETAATKEVHERKKRRLMKLEQQLQSLKLKCIDKEESLYLDLVTSRANYIDPRITVAWCLKWNVPLRKIYNKTLLEKFKWAIGSVRSDFKF